MSWQNLSMKEFDSETGSNFDLGLASQWTADIHFHIR